MEHEIEVFANKDVHVTNRETGMPVAHQFSNDIYARTIFMPKGSLVVGKKHKTRHFNFIMSGKAVLYMDGVKTYLEAPYLLESLEGSRKVLLIEEDMYWTTVHSTETQDIEELEVSLIEDQTIEEILAELKQSLIQEGE
jgi:sulfur transfer complex TusBCD TusB component (DsrH family)